MVDSFRIKFDSSFINGKSAEKISVYLNGFNWDYIWELLDIINFINLFSICQPLSPSRTATGKT
jgi:hypothetical protein